MRRITLLFITFLFSISGINGELYFSDINLSPRNTLLFKAFANFPGYGTYETLFSSDLATGKITQLTFFPEKIQLIDNNDRFQIQNRYGVFRTDFQYKNISPLKIFPAFVHGNEIESGKISPLKTSPDGKFLVYFKATSPAFGNLMIYDITHEKEVEISKGILLSLENPPVLWSPDSKYFIYSKNNQLYYFSINQLLKNHLLIEKYRKVAQGQLANAQWDKNGNLFILDGYFLYRIQAGELFTQAIYVGFIRIGTIVGKIPFKFNVNLDRFWISPDGNKILLDKQQQNIFLYFLNNEDYLVNGNVKSLPYLFLPKNTRIKAVFWSLTDQITILAESIEKGKTFGSVFRLKIPSEGDIPGFTQTTDTGVKNMHFSDDEERILLVKDDKIEVYNYASWKKIRELTAPYTIDALWKSENEIIIAGAYSIELFNLNLNASTLITLSQPGITGFSKNLYSVLTKKDNKVFTTGPEKASWENTGTWGIAEHKTLSDKYRVYIEEIDRGNYKNMIMIRDLAGLSTHTLFPFKSYAYEKFPKQEQEIDYTYFNHGSRVRRREVAIVFNAIDSAEGLSTILTILKDYGIRCTFFINGEFIRRFPDAVKDIAESGHEAGSLFYAYFDMTDSQLNIDVDFIKKGLARNEDDYFKTTKKELSLLWHTPFYFVNSEIIRASREMNYSYVGRDIDTLDWVSKRESNISTGTFKSSPELIERIIRLKKPGSIIPIRVGISVTDRAEYLYQSLDILINSLLKLGYRIVPVSTLMEHAK